VTEDAMTERSGSHDLTATPRRRDRDEAPSWRDRALVAVAALFAIGSIVAMVLTIAAAERSAFVIAVEAATWIGATGAVVVILWRRTRWGRRR
jgi:hypothetical protein